MFFRHCRNQHFLASDVRRRTSDVRRRTSHVGRPTSDVGLPRRTSDVRRVSAGNRSRRRQKYELLFLMRFAIFLFVGSSSDVSYPGFLKLLLGCNGNRLIKGINRLIHGTFLPINGRGPGRCPGAAAMGGGLGGWRLLGPGRAPSH